ncbi:MAG: DUF2269 domain-containing protein [Alphaproteobacteria bacterium]|nr:DUF2269 domain-containing protein [Alphaproteobacteria bacterium]
MDGYFIVKTLHIMSSTILFGTGLGIAFFMLRSYFTTNPQEKLFAVKNTVLADYIFTAPAVLLQPLTGFWLLSKGGYSATDSWLVVTYILYALAGACWLPVVWIQIRLKHMLTDSIRTGQALPPRYHRLFRTWFILGWPAFIALVIIFFLMVYKPT